MQNKEISETLLEDLSSPTHGDGIYSLIKWVGIEGNIWKLLAHLMALTLLFTFLHQSKAQLNGSLFHSAKMQ